MRFIFARRWKQFSLGTASIFLTLLCVLFGLWSNGVHRQRKAVAAISRLGGSVEYRGEERDVVGRESWIPNRLKNFVGRDLFDPVTTVYLPREFRDADLVCLEDLPDVEGTYVGGPGFTDQSLRKLRGFRRLRWFTSANAKFSDEGLRELSRHHNLVILHLFSDVHQPRITDAGFRHLRQLKNLSELAISGVKISGGAVKELQQALPNCDVSVFPPDEEELFPARSPLAPPS